MSEGIRLRTRHVQGERDNQDSAETLPRPHGNRGFFKKKRFAFFTGIIAGLLITAAFSLSHPNLQGTSNKLNSFSHLAFDEVLTNLTSLLTPQDQDFLPALRLINKKDLAKKHPVVLVPGIVSTGLENWSLANCSRSYFRRRMWGTATMFKATLLDKDCWMSHMKLDINSGLDNPGRKLRAAQGLEAADYFLGSYWLWSKLIENLAVLGYDNNDMHLAAYDWRLSYPNLEIRDNYFSKLKTNLELYKKINKNKVVIVAHSMGANVILYFMKWVASAKHGGGGQHWVDDHIHAFINIGGPLLGVPKTLSTMISGEMRDTAQMGKFGSLVLEKFLSKHERVDLFRSWGGLASMLPKGGDVFWGNHETAPDIKNNSVTRGNYMINFLESHPNLTMSDVYRNMTTLTDKRFSELISNVYSHGIAATAIDVQQNEGTPKKWSNVLEFSLPSARNMSEFKIFCLYGHGKSTERAYYYTDSASEDTEYANAPPAHNLSSEMPKIQLDVTVNDPMNSIESGVVCSDGDGTVPLISLGYMCRKGWKKPMYNPSAIPVLTKEYQHHSANSVNDFRGGASSGDHVDILGNWELIEDILNIAAGSESFQEKIVSDIDTIVSDIN